jgi:competence protein ComEA
MAPRNVRWGWAAGVAGAALVLGLGLWTPRQPAPEGQVSPQASASAQSAPKAAARAAKPVRRPVHLNTATSRQLRELPGVGELLAQRIIAARPFKRVEDLADVKGMGPERYARLVPLVAL